MKIFTLKLIPQTGSHCQKCGNTHSGLSCAAC
jgi:hypothetical protein